METCGNGCISPNDAESASSIPPPSSIAAPEVNGVDAGKSSERFSTEPNDQAVAPTRIATQGSTPNCGSPPCNSSTPTPQNPSKVEARRRQWKRCCRKTSVSMTSVMSGSVASSTDAMPEGTYSSAQNSSPYSATNM